MKFYKTKMAKQEKMKCVLFFVVNHCKYYSALLDGPTKYFVYFLV